MCQYSSTDNGITAKIFVDLITDEDIDDPSLNFSFGGKVAIKKVLEEIKVRFTDTVVIVREN